MKKGTKNVCDAREKEKPNEQQGKIYMDYKDNKQGENVVQGSQRHQADDAAKRLSEAELPGFFVRVQSFENF